MQFTHTVTWMQLYDDHVFHFYRKKSLFLEGQRYKKKSNDIKKKKASLKDWNSFFKFLKIKKKKNPSLLINIQKTLSDKLTNMETNHLFYDPLVLCRVFKYQVISLLYDKAMLFQFVKCHVVWLQNHYVYGLIVHDICNKNLYFQHEMYIIYKCRSNYVITF